MGGATGCPGVNPRSSGVKSSTRPLAITAVLPQKGIHAKRPDGKIRAEVGHWESPKCNQ